MGPPSYMRSVVDRNVVMRRIPVIMKIFINSNTKFRSATEQPCSTLHVTKSSLEKFRLPAGNRKLQSARSELKCVYGCTGVLVQTLQAVRNTDNDNKSLNTE